MPGRVAAVARHCIEEGRDYLLPDKKYTLLVRLIRVIIHATLPRPNRLMFQVVHDKSPGAYTFSGGSGCLD